MIKKVKKITEYLRGKYNPEVIILHGSRASEKYRENSDWDLYVLVKSEVQGGTELFEGESLDVEVIKIPIGKDKLAEIFGPTLQHARVLFDNSEALGEEVIRQAQQIYLAGKKLSGRDYENRRNMAYRILQRMKGAVDNEMLFFRHAANFYEKTIRYWFESQGQWSKTVHEAIDYIQTKDMEYHTWLKILASNVDTKTKVETAEKIYHRLFGSSPWASQ